MKDLAILNLEFLFFILAFLEKSRQSICSRICLILAIIDVKIVSRELLGLADLLRVQVFCIHETMKVIVVHKDEKLMLAALQVVAPNLKCFNNG